MPMIELVRLGQDAELRYAPGGTAVANLSCAYSYGKKGDDGKRPTQWIEAALWGSRAEKLAQYLTKGSQHMITVDDVHIETYTHNNESRNKLVGRVSDIKFAGGERSQQASTANVVGAEASGGGNLSDFDDHIPF